MMMRLPPRWEQAWLQMRGEWQSSARLRAGVWAGLGIFLLFLLLLGLDHVDARRAELKRLQDDQQRLRTVPLGEVWRQRNQDVQAVLSAYQASVWAEADVGLSEAAFQDWLRTLTGRLGLNVRELTVARVDAPKAAAAASAVPAPSGHVPLRARLVLELQRTAVMTLLAELAQAERSVVVERLVWRAAAQAPTVELELRAIARSAQRDAGKGAP